MLYLAGTDTRWIKIIRRYLWLCVQIGGSFFLSACPSITIPRYVGNGSVLTFCENDYGLAEGVCGRATKTAAIAVRKEEELPIHLLLDTFAKVRTASSKTLNRTNVRSDKVTQDKHTYYIRTYLHLLDRCLGPKLDFVQLNWKVRNGFPLEMVVVAVLARAGADDDGPGGWACKGKTK